ncbi:MAG: YigZ family protein [Bacteroidales bacterium]|nr:YigZ family protein [Bacteroidales bacterium]
MSDTYRSISGHSRGIYKELGSKFLAFAHPVETEEQVKDILSGIRKEYFDARHHCYAWRLGLGGEPYRMNDDGEPSSTAGRPIHGQLLSNGLSDILVVVVRYFGGTKLGVPGLIRAYKSATQDAIANAEIIEKIAGELFTLKFGYLQMNDVMKVLKDMGIQPLGQTFDLDCTLEVRVRLAQIEDFRKQLAFCQIN